MKKIVYLLFIMLFLLTGCKKNSITLEEFINQARFDGYMIKESKTGYEDETYIKNVYYALSIENDYDMQFLELENDDYAKKFFLVNANSIKNELTSKDYYKSKSLTNYELVHGENDTKYLLVIRSYNNIIYIDADINYINNIEEFLDELDLEY